MPPRRPDHNDWQILRECRIDKIVDLKIRGASIVQITQQFEKDGDPLSKRQIFRLAKRAADRLKETTEHRCEVLLDLQSARCDLLFATAYSQGDCATALKVLQHHASLYGLYADKSVNVDGRGVSVNIFQRIETLNNELRNLNGGNTVYPGYP